MSNPSPSLKAQREQLERQHAGVGPRVEQTEHFQKEWKPLQEEVERTILPTYLEWRATARAARAPRPRAGLLSGLFALLPEPLLRWLHGLPRAAPPFERGLHRLYRVRLQSGVNELALALFQLIFLPINGVARGVTWARDRLESLIYIAFTLIVIVLLLLLLGWIASQLGAMMSGP